ncbi:peptide deformylase [Pullulanibacillus pueri]|uniref:Peptide deformylase n=1 Tax=Pullulanibacillus pueri TaxID=1437324 RepID=A0A8J2ZRF5_9BACL|nr:peptide deformylase [Pullulanibacillus pueri]MBM7680072.1 peptide deformylase [Pullulanibacillus pueri]GGH74237.1 peptide deformylase [Pullulanibacillus pueri]
MITMDDIIREGNPILRTVAEEVPLPPSEEDKATLKEMLEFLKNSQDDEIAAKYNLRAGIGLAAPQIGLKKRMIALYLTDEKDKLHEYALFNPKIVSHSVEETYLESGEGCLSVDRDVPGYVPRFSRVKVSAIDINNKPVVLKLRGLPAIAIQHEIDHLNGIMFYDRINKEDPYKVPEKATTER